MQQVERKGVQECNAKALGSWSARIAGFWHGFCTEESRPTLGAIKVHHASADKVQALCGELLSMSR